MDPCMGWDFVLRSWGFSGAFGCQADFPRPSPNLPSGSERNVFFLQRWVRVRRRFVIVERWKRFQWKVTLPKFRLWKVTISKGDQSSNQPFSDACFMEHDVYLFVTFMFKMTRGERWIEMKVPNKNRSSWWFNPWPLYPHIGGHLTKSPAESSEPILLKVE